MAPRTEYEDNSESERKAMGKPAVSLESTYGAGVDLRSYADKLLETTRVEYVDEGVLLVMAPAGFEHRMIIDAIKRAYCTSQTSVDWATHSENFQWDLPDDTGRFYVPDLVVTRKASTAAEERAAIVPVVEVTSPKSPDGEEIPLPEPFGFAIPTDEWPKYSDYVA